MECRSIFAMAEVIFVISAALINSVPAKIGYSINVVAEGNAWEIERSTQNIYFSADGKVTGEGNFSKLARISGGAGISSEATASSTQIGIIESIDTVRYSCKEGPVVVSVDLVSKNLTEGYAIINIDEKWPESFFRYSQMNYLGPMIRTREKYETRANTIYSLIESKKLSKQSLFAADIDNTSIDVIVAPGKLQERWGGNMSSYYSTETKTMGELYRLNVDRHGNDNDIFKIAQEYRGQVETILSIKMNDTDYFENSTSYNFDGWLPGCVDDSVFDLPDRLYLHSYLNTLKS